MCLDVLRVKGTIYRNLKYILALNYDALYKKYVYYFLLRSA